MDNSAPEITFNKQGVCNFCTEAQRELNILKLLTPSNYEHKERYLRRKLETGEKYDVLIGLSGGVDSSYALYNAVKLGLKPLCFSIDTGYNKPEADENIMRLVEGLKVPFFRYTIDLKKFQELQGAFLRAGVKNIEIPTDHVLMAASYEMASKHGIKTIISGGNVATESIMPASWGYSARDLVHIKAIYKWATGKKLTGLPLCSLLKYNYYLWVKKIKTVYILDYYKYNRIEAEKFLCERFGFKSTGEKHEENYFTWWFQNYYLFTKFGIDKRKAHYSSLINSGQMTRDEALEKLASDPIYPELGIEKRVLNYAKREHESFPTDKRLYDFIRKTVKLCGF
jgi:N-acetyl sugar amidotransferase